MVLPTERFDAFISYKHGAIAGFAKALRRRLQRYGCPFLKRSRRIFRDEDYITADPDLPAVVARSIRASRNLILLASPEAAASEWVEHELREWCSLAERLDHLVIVLVGGTIVTGQEQRIDWEMTTALPKCLQEQLKSVPFYVDMTWASEEPFLPLSSQRVKKSINNIVAKIDGVTPEEMLGVAGDAHRQNWRRASWAASAIVVLLVGVGILLRLTKAQRNRAGLEHKAELALDKLHIDPTEGLLLAIQATRLSLDQERVVIPSVQRTLGRAMEESREENVFHHDAVVHTVAFSTEGSVVASGGSDGTIRLWGINAQEVGEPLFHGSEVRSLAFGTAEGAYLVSGARDGGLRIWDRTGLPVGEPREHPGGVTTVAWQPNGPWFVSGGNKGTLCLWRLGSSASHSSILAHPGGVWSIAFSPDGRWLASGGADRRVRIWAVDATNGRLRLAGTGAGHEGPVMCVAFLPGGGGFISGGDRTLRKWDLAGRPSGAPLQGHAGVVSVAVDPLDGGIVTGNIDGTVRRFEPNGDKASGPFRGPAAAVSSVAYSPKGKLILVGSVDGTVRVLDYRGSHVGPLASFNTGMFAVTFSRDGRLAVGGQDGVLRVLRVGPNRTLDSLSQPRESHQGSIWSLATSVDGKWIVSGADDGTVRVWDWEARLAVPPLVGHEGGVMAVAVQSSGMIVSAGNDGTIRTWTLDGRAKDTIARHDGAILSIGFNPRRPLVAAGLAADQHWRIWATDRMQAASLEGVFRGRHNSLAFSPDGQVLLAANGNRWQLWDWQRGRLTRDVTAHVGRVMSLAFSPDGKLIASGGSNDHAVSLWGRDGSLLSQFVRHSREVLSVAFSPDGTLVASTGWDGTVRLWRASWQDWLRVSCQRLRHHPRMLDKDDPLARNAFETCERLGGSENGRTLAELVE